MRTETAPAAIVKDLVHAISIGRLGPGDRLPSELELSKTYQVAPMTLRGALAAMRELELVETRRGRLGGTYVRDDVAERLQGALAGAGAVSAQDLQDLLEWRRAISGEACTLAAVRRTSAEVEEFWALSRDFDAQPAELAPRRLVDARLHTFIAKSARSAHLLREEIEIQEQLSRIILSLPNLASFYSNLPHTHDPLIRAIRDGDADGARSAMIEHAEASYEWCLSLTGLEPASNVERSTAVDAVK
jgi:GntR family transcriptional repressor for pyruvate dehydrogenase complex